MASALTVNRQDFQIALGADAAVPLLSLTGNISLRDPAELNAFFDQVHDELRSRGVRQVAVDVRELQFINSTGFKPLIYWVNRITELDAPAQYQVRVLSSSKRRWQGSFLTALTCFAPALVSVEADPA